MNNKSKTVDELGWKDGMVADFLELTPEESALIEIKLALGKHLHLRGTQGMIGVELGEKARPDPDTIF